MITTSKLVIQSMIFDREYSTRVLPYIKEEYFDEKSEKILFAHVKSHLEKYRNTPSIEVLRISIEEDHKINETVSKEINSIINEIEKYNQQDMEYLIDKTERFCQDMALHNAIVKAVEIIGGDEKKLDKGAIPDLLKEALAISFESSLGHDYTENAENRHDYYHRKEEKVPFDLKIFNDITKGGFSKKTINVYIAGTHVGKTLLMCHQAAANLMMGFNVLYISLEMREEEISRRIDANILDIDIADIQNIPKDIFLKKINNIGAKTKGKLIVKEYPMASAGAGHFKAFVNDLKLKQKFVPDIIYIDYLNICISTRYKNNSDANSYTLMKSVSEELRGMASELNVPVVTATQFNRGAHDDSDPGMGGISESFAVLFGCDFVAALVAPDELKERGQVMVKQLKNRYDDVNKISKFFVGLDRKKMKFYELDEKESVSTVIPHDLTHKFGERPSGNSSNKETNWKF